MEYEDLAIDLSWYCCIYHYGVFDWHISDLMYNADINFRIWRSDLWPFICSNYCNLTFVNIALSVRNLICCFRMLLYVPAIKQLCIPMIQCAKIKDKFTMQTLLDFQNLMQNTGEKQFPDALIHVKIYIIWPQMNGHLIGNYTATT